jgi:hypothetical protein
MSLLLVVATLLAAGSEPLVLENPRIRIEADPALFEVTFVGLPGGENFLDTSVEPGAPSGLETVLVPVDIPEDQRFEGPGTLLDRGDDYLVMERPLTEDGTLLMRKDIRLYPGIGRASNTVTVQCGGEDVRRFTVRNTARVPKGSTLRLEKRDCKVLPLAGTDSPFPSVVKSLRYWLIPVPPTSRTENVVLGAYVPRVVQQNGTGSWTRQLLDMPGDAGDIPAGCTFLCLLDDATASYGSALQGAMRPVRPGGSLKFQEVWTVDRRGRSGGGEP